MTGEPHVPEPDSLGGWLKALRLASGRTQEEVAIDAGVGKRSLERWEADDGTPRGPAFLRLLSALGVQVGAPNAPQAVSAELRDLRQTITSVLGDVDQTLNALTRPSASRQQPETPALIARLESLEEQVGENLRAIHRMLDLSERAFRAMGVEVELDPPTDPPSTRVG